MTYRTLNWLLACLIALLMSCTWMLDGPSDIDAARDVAADVIDAQAKAFADATPKGGTP